VLELTGRAALELTGPTRRFASAARRSLPDWVSVPLKNAETSGPSLAAKGG